MAMTIEGRRARTRELLKMAGMNYIIVCNSIYSVRERGAIDCAFFNKTDAEHALERLSKIYRDEEPFVIEEL